MALDHDPACGCDRCRAVRRYALPLEQSDFDRLADAWAFWVGTKDGEAAKIRDGDPGAPGSLRWAAMQAIAAARIAASEKPGGAAATSPGTPNPDAAAAPPATASIARPIGFQGSGPSITLEDGA